MRTRYRQAIANLTAKEQMFSRKLVDNDFDISAGEEAAEIDFIGRTTPGVLNPLLTRYLVTDEVELGTEITYSFPPRTRVNRFAKVIFNDLGEASQDGRTGKYGADNISMRLLYELLCQAREGNVGEYFIDTYFEEDFPHSAVYPRYVAIREKITENMATELREQKGSALRNISGRFSSASQVTQEDLKKEYERMYDSWDQFRVWKEQHIMKELNDVGQAIRADIIMRLETGILQLNKTSLAESTKRRRAALGLNANKIFYASGQLINSLKIFISLDKEAL